MIQMEIDYEAPPRFHGATYEHERDYLRLSAQLRKVFDAMRDGQWRSLEEIMCLTSSPQASVSARLRDLRKNEFGGHTVQRRHVSNGLHRYRLLLRTGKAVWTGKEWLPYPAGMDDVDADGKRTPDGFYGPGDVCDLAPLDVLEGAHVC